MLTLMEPDFKSVRAMCRALEETLQVVWQSAETRSAAPTWQSRDPALCGQALAPQSHASTALRYANLRGPHAVHRPREAIIDGRISCRPVPYWSVCSRGESSTVDLC